MQLVGSGGPQRQGRYLSRLSPARGARVETPGWEAGTDRYRIHLLPCHPIVYGSNTADGVAAAHAGGPVRAVNWGLSCLLAGRSAVLGAGYLGSGPLPSPAVIIITSLSSPPWFAKPAREKKERVQRCVRATRSSIRKIDKACVVTA